MMSERLPVEETNIDGYGAHIIQWTAVREVLSAQHPPEVPFFLGTIRPDGRPHAVGIGPIWLDGDMYFSCGLQSQKAKNLAANPACTLSTRLPGFDVTIEGTAARLDDPVILARVAAQFVSGGWPAEVQGEALTAPYSAPSAGPPPWHVFRLRFGTVVALALSGDGGATRWRFEALD